jgi:hypothetical protein
MDSTTAPPEFDPATRVAQPTLANTINSIKTALRIATSPSHKDEYHPV